MAVVRSVGRAKELLDFRDFKGHRGELERIVAELKNNIKHLPPGFLEDETDIIWNENMGSAVRDAEYYMDEECTMRISDALATSTAFHQLLLMKLQDMRPENFVDLSRRERLQITPDNLWMNWGGMAFIGAGLNLYRTTDYDYRRSDYGDSLGRRCFLIQVIRLPMTAGTRCTYLVLSGSQSRHTRKWNSAILPMETKLQSRPCTLMRPLLHSVQDQLLHGSVGSVHRSSQQPPLLA